MIEPRNRERNDNKWRSRVLTKRSCNHRGEGEEQKSSVKEGQWKAAQRRKETEAADSEKEQQ